MRKVLFAVAVVYLACVWLDAAGSSIPWKVLPRWGVYFTQIACLFPHASIDAIDYRAQGWACGRQRWEAIDIAPDFPIDPNDKENRFQRVMHFYRANRPTMRALGAYLVHRHNGRVRKGEVSAGSRALIGGVRLLDLRIPIPAPGQHVDRFRRKPLAAYPESERHYFYWTPHSMRDERCAALFPEEGQP